MKGGPMPVNAYQCFVTMISRKYKYCMSMHKISFITSKLCTYDFKKSFKYRTKSYTARESEEKVKENSYRKQIHVSTCPQPLYRRIFSFVGYSSHPVQKFFGKP